MIEEIFIKIGSKTIIFIEKITGKTSENRITTDEKEITDKTFNEIIKRNSNEKRSVNYKILLIPLILSTILLVTNNLQLLVEITAIVILILLFRKSLPRIKEENRKKEILQKLPYALRQMSTQLQAGIGLYDSMKTISTGNYGALSDEFRITLNEIQYGTNYVEAFEKLSKRNKLQTIEKLVSQIIRTLNNGGNLAKTLNTLADENSYNMKIKYKEYSEKLNAIMLLYMFIAVLLPVILFIMIIAATTVMGSIVKPELLLILYLFFFPLIIVFMIILIKRMEPTLS